MRGTFKYGGAHTGRLPGKAPTVNVQVSETNNPTAWMPEWFMADGNSELARRMRRQEHMARLREVAKGFRCPECKAEAGFACRRLEGPQKGKRTQAHKSRVAKAELLERGDGG